MSNVFEMEDQKISDFGYNTMPYTNYVEISPDL